LSEDCRTAFEAALELIEEKCGIKIGGKTVRISEVEATLKVPEKVEEIAATNPEMTREEKVKAISDSAWAKGYAEGVCRWVTGEAKPECVERLSRQVAERVVS